jgi:predicted RNase H-like nuclease (RuvC/YqgF family)
MSSLDIVLKRLKRQYEAYNNERNDEDEEGFIDISLVCSLADSIPYLTEKLKEQQEKIEQLEEDCAYWKIKHRDLVTLDEHEE